MSNSPHVSIGADTLFTVGNLAVTNSMLTSLIVSSLIIAFAIIVRIKLKSTSRPQGLQNLAEWMVESLFNLVSNVSGDSKKSRLFFPLIGTFFFFILFNNWSGLIPGVGTIGIVNSPDLEQHDTTAEPVNRDSNQHSLKIIQSVSASDDNSTNLNDQENLGIEEDTMLKTSEVSEEHTIYKPLFRPATSDLNTTIALALISVTATQFYGLKIAHLGYLKKFFNFSSPILFFVGILELISEFAKIISFAFRLFGNVFAGEVLLVVITFLVPIILPMPFYGLEIFVGFIQALVFAMLTLVFFNMATASHDH